MAGGGVRPLLLLSGRGSSHFELCGKPGYALSQPLMFQMLSPTENALAIKVPIP